jgi:hypothetical protein
MSSEVLVPPATAGVLSRFEAAKRALAEARGIDEVKQVRDQAEALRLYIRQRGDSLEMQNAVAEIKLRAERRAGELLASMEKNKGARGMGVPSHDATAPTLGELGISRSQSSRWQREAGVEPDDFERFLEETKAKGEELTSRGLLDLARETENADRLQRRTEAARAYAATVTADEYQGILVGDMGILWDRLEDGSVAMFLSDPPYDPESRGLYARLAELAARKLRPGGLCLAYAGIMYLPELMNSMGEHLEYFWTFSLHLRQSPMAVWSRHIQQRWKAILAYGRPPLAPAPVWLADVLEGGGREKDLHEWQQSQDEAEYVIERLTNPGDLVVDPFCGSGTVCAAARATGRRWLATEIDPDRAAVAKQRLGQTAEETQTPVLAESA